MSAARNNLSLYQTSPEIEFILSGEIYHTDAPCGITTLHSLALETYLDGTQHTPLNGSLQRIAGISWLPGVKIILTYSRLSFAASAPTHRCTALRLSSPSIEPYTVDIPMSLDGSQRDFTVTSGELAVRASLGDAGPTELVAYQRQVTSGAQAFMNAHYM